MNYGRAEVAIQSDPVQEAKTVLRQDALNRRRQLRVAADAGAAMRLADSLLAALTPAAGAVVSAYWPIRDEIDPRPLMARLEDQGCVCGLPVIAGAGESLRFRRWRPGGPLVAGPFGTSEPPADADEIDPEILFVPLLAFDRAGHRLGYGGGYYDRTLAAMRARRRVTAVGLAFAGQEVPQVPHDPTDARLDWIATEAGVLPIAEGSGAGA